MKIDIKKIASILMIVAITAISGNLLQAQQRDQKGPPPIPNSSQIKTMVMKLSGTLVLNDVQSKQIFDLYTAHFKEVSAKIEASRPARNEMEAIKSKFEKEVKSVLTTEQQKGFEAFLKQQEPKQEGRPHSRK
ncbi:MAG: hypothetical protein ACERIH_09335 [Labilibaculum antarcticum]